MLAAEPTNWLRAVELTWRKQALDTGVLSPPSTLEPWLRPLSSTKQNKAKTRAKTLIFSKKFGLDRGTDSLKNGYVTVLFLIAFLRKVYSILSLQVLLTTVTSALFLYFETLRTFVHER